jgi:predicted Ser/Thr protein kinase
MADAYDHELRLALEEGFLTPEDAAELMSKAGQRRCAPLDLLVEAGRISQEKANALRERALTISSAPTAPSATVSSLEANATAPSDAGGPTPGASSEVPEFPIRNWDRYTPIRLLGKGGMGAVFLATDKRLGRQVALKFVRTENARQAEQLVIEARAQARVNHDRVCKVFEVGEVNGQVYIAMQYIEGKPLNVAATHLSFEQRAMVIRDAAEGVHEAHRAGIIHRDLKPGNILIQHDVDGRMKTFVLDFGIAHDRVAGTYGSWKNRAIAFSPFTKHQLRESPPDSSVESPSAGRTVC